MRSRTNGKSIIAAFRTGIASILVLVFVLGTAGTAAQPLDTDSAAADRLSLDPGTAPLSLAEQREPRLVEWGSRPMGQELPHLPGPWLSQGDEQVLGGDIVVTHLSRFPLRGLKNLL